MIGQIELQKAIYKALSESYEVTEIKPTEPIFPWIEIGNIIERDISIKTNKRSAFNITIHTFTKGNDSTESKILNEYVKNKMLNLVVTNGFSVDYVTLDTITTLKEVETDGTIFHGVLFFNANLTERNDK